MPSPVARMHLRIIQCRASIMQSWLLERSAWIVAAVAIAILLLGYHPYAEDGGIYTAAIEARLHPTLFPHDRLWVTAHTRYALFVPVVAFLTRFSHLPLTTILLTLQAFGLLALISGAGHLARTCFPNEHRPWLSILIIAIGAGLPVAGTALYLVDPYCSARTITTPLLLFALSFVLRRRWLATIVCWTVAATMHPLMAIWGALPLLLIAIGGTRHPRRWTIALATATILTAGLLTSLSPNESAEASVIAQTRAYWFLSRWQWYEWLGVVAPCALFAWILYRHSVFNRVLRQLASATLLSTILATALALCFARPAARTLAIARLQPMRCLHLVTLAFLVIGGALLQRLLRTKAQAAVVLAALAIGATALFIMQRSLFRSTPHFEWPGAPARNAWEAAFVWCRDNTPTNALFALDADYINDPGQDTHGFRSLALRSALPDRVKDAGIAAVLPFLANSWSAGVAATSNLDHLSDEERRTRLLPLGATWIVLPASAHTSLPCPFRNTAASVCSLQTVAKP